jgi:hypothetical protein
MIMLANTNIITKRRSKVKKKYEPAELDLILLNAADVIRTSGEGDDDPFDDGHDPEGWV